MPLYLIKVSGRDPNAKTRLESVAFIVRAGDRLVARGMAIDYFKKHVGEEVLSVLDVIELPEFKEEGVLLGFRVAYDPTPISTTILIPTK